MAKLCKSVSVCDKEDETSFLDHVD